MQVPLIQNEHMVQTLGSHRSNPSLHDSVGLGRSERGTDRGDVEAIHPSIEARSKATVAVVYEEAWGIALPTACFHDLLPHPFACRMSRDSHMHDFSAGVMDNEEDVDRPEKDRPHAKEIVSPDFPGMCGEKESPTERRIPVMGTSHVFRHSSGRDLESEPGQFCLDPPLTPQAVLCGHASDERPKLDRDAASPDPACAT